MNLCGKRDVRSGKVTDNRCLLTRALNNNVQLDNLTSGILTALLSGNIFESNFDAGRLTSSNSSSGVIQYNIGFGRNINLPNFNLVTSVQNQPRVILTYRNDNVKFYDYMFPNSIALSNYKSVYNWLDGKEVRLTDSKKYRVY